MARSRVGGTSGMLSGRVGDVIYSITRNADGSFRQQAAFNDGIRENPNTDAQARARLTMATVERAMFTFRDFMGTGFEGVALGTNSVSKFSEVNYNAMKYEIDEYWDEPEWPDYNYDFPRKGQGTPKDGCFIISQGSLGYNNYIHLQGANADRDWFGVETQDLEQPVTVRKFLGRNGLKPGMQFVGIFYCEGVTPSKSFVAWLMFWTDETVNLDAILTSSNWRNYIHTNSNVLMNAYMVNNTGKLWLRCENIAQYQISRTGCTGKRLRIRDGNIYRYSNCEMMWACFPDPQTAWGWKTVGDVKNSWIDVPPSPRLPFTYQEVEWIQRVSGNRTLIKGRFKPRFAKIKMRMSGDLGTSQYYLYTNKGPSRILIQRGRDNSGYFLNFSCSGSDSILSSKKIRIDSQRFDGFIEIERFTDYYKCSIDNSSVNVPVSESDDSDPIKSLYFWYPNKSTFVYQVYEVICYDVRDNSLMLDLVPCFRKSDGFCGFFDLVSQTFITGQTESDQYVHGGLVNK